MSLPIRVSEESREPTYHQIETQMKALIVGGHLPARTSLPSIRALASELSCSVITTRRAYQNLENQDYIKTVQGKGTFVKEIQEQDIEATKQKVVYDALLKAIQQGTQVGYSAEEIRGIFEEIIQSYKKGHS